MDTGLTALILSDTYIDDLMQNCSNSTVLAMESVQSYTEPSMCQWYISSLH